MKLLRSKHHHIFWEKCKKGEIGSFAFIFIPSLTDGLYLTIYLYKIKLNAFVR